MWRTYWWLGFRKDDSWIMTKFESRPDNYEYHTLLIVLLNSATWKIFFSLNVEINEHTPSNLTSSYF